MAERITQLAEAWGRKEVELASGRLPAREAGREEEVRGSRGTKSRQASTCPASSQAAWSTFLESRLLITRTTTVPAPPLPCALHRGEASLASALCLAAEKIHSFTPSLTLLT